MRPLETGRHALESLHSRCFACGESEAGLGLTFSSLSTNSVAADWFCAECYQSYDGIIHGGIIATLIDAAMTNCLLLQGIDAVTADLQIRYKAPLQPGNHARVSARMIELRRSFYILEGQIQQDDIIAAVANARFVKRKRDKQTDV